MAFRWRATSASAFIFLADPSTVAQRNATAASATHLTLLLMLINPSEADRHTTRPEASAESPFLRIDSEIYLMAKALAAI